MRRAARDVSLPVQQGEFDKALDRLMARGLIAEGAGDTQVEALYDLMSNLYVAPLDNRFFATAGGRLEAGTDAADSLLCGEKAAPEG